jgi:anthranilate phosphoribosyltransferase
VIGVPSLELAEKIVSAVIQLGTKHTLVVHGLNGMDEISISGKSMCWEVKNGKVYTSGRYILPEEFGIKSVPAKSVQGGAPEENAETILHILEGVKGAKRDIVVLNAAAALLAGNRVRSLRQGVVLAQETIDSGHALVKLKHLVEITRKLTESKDDSGPNSTK